MQKYKAAKTSQGGIKILAFTQYLPYQLTVNVTSLNNTNGINLLHNRFYGSISTHEKVKFPNDN